jgi:hypothetical protein
MSGPSEQQTNGALDQLEQGAIDRAQAKGGIVDQTWTWLELNWLNLMAGLPAVIATIFLVEITKDWVKLLAAKKLGESYNDKIENLIVRTWTVPCAFVWVATLNFTGSWNQMTGSNLAWWQGMLLGTTMTTGIALGVVWVMDYLKVAETARVRFQRLTGVSKEDIEAARTQKAPNITADLESLRKKPTDKE